MQQAMRNAAAARIVGLLVLRWGCPDGQEYAASWLQVGQPGMLASHKTLGIPKTPSTRPKRHLRKSRVVLEHVEVLVEVDALQAAIAGPDQWLWFALADERVRLLVGQAFGHGRHYFT